jgi:predicted lysophospholipase L1 biosynthesis ABC-type transport system permease subunit
LIPIATAQETAGPDQPLIPSSYVVTFRGGVDRGAAVARLGQLFPRTVLVAPSSVDVETLRRVDWLPIALAGLVGLLTIGTLAHVIVTSVQRHGHDFGVLQSIGFTRKQIGSVVLAMAVIVAVLMLLIGVPIGVAAGRMAWTIVANGLGTEADPHLPPWLVMIVPATIAVAVLTSLLPAQWAIRRRPAEALQRE